MSAVGNWLLSHLFAAGFGLAVALVLVHFAPHERIPEE